MIDPLISVVMGSQSDWEVMQHASSTLELLGVSHECKIVSAHRTPHRLVQFAEAAKDRGIRAIIAGAGGAAHMPGMIASLTSLPVLGVPIDVTSLNGIDSLYSILQMPAGVPVACFAIGKPGAVNAALFSVSLLSKEFTQLNEALVQFRKRQTEQVPLEPTIYPAVAGNNNATKPR